MTRITETAERVLQEGERPIIKDNYEQRLDYLAATLSGESREFQAQVLNEIHNQDPGAYDSWLKSNRLEDLVGEGLITQQESDDLIAAYAYGIDNGIIPADSVPGAFIRDANNSELTSAYIGGQDLSTREGFDRAVTAFSGIPADRMAAFINDPANAQTVQDLQMAVQQHQDWYERLTVDLTVVSGQGGFPVTHDADVSFSTEQLQAMREAFKQNDGLLVNGELLLAYPDRQERNEAVTQQYYDISNSMAGIVGGDNANWASYAVWASDEIGRNLEGTTGIAISEAVYSDPKYWLSKGNSMLISDIGPAFQHFIQTFGNGQNQDMTFEQFWSSLESEYGGRGISYLDGNNDPELDMKNAFKAYYESMKLHQQEAQTTDPAARQELSDRRAQLMLYGNTLVGLQEQHIVDHEIDEGMKAFGVVNPLGASGPFLDFHLPAAGGNGTIRLDTDQDVQNTDSRVDLGGQTFVTADGTTIDLEQAVNDRLNGLDGDPNNENEADVGNSGTNRWDDYSQRMGYIYHMFANYQQHPDIFSNPRDVAPSRAEPLNNDPGEYITVP